MTFIWLGIALLLTVPVSVALLLMGLYVHLWRTYLHYVVRIFQEKPIFIIPKGQPVPEAEEIRFRTADGLTLCGCYLRATTNKK